MMIELWVAQLAVAMVSVAAAVALWLMRLKLRSALTEIKLRDENRVASKKYISVLRDTEESLRNDLHEERHAATIVRLRVQNLLIALEGLPVNMIGADAVRALSDPLLKVREVLK